MDLSRLRAGLSNGLCASALGLLLATAATSAPCRVPPPSGELVLDAERPFVDATIAGTRVRLRVDPAQWYAVEINDDVAARLPVVWESDQDLVIGRVTLRGRSVQTALGTRGRTRPVLVTSHGRIVEDADGLVGPDALPYATIRWVRRDTPPPSATINLPLILGETTGFAADAPGLGTAVRLQFSLRRTFSEATGAAGSILARRYGGAFVGPAVPVPALFGVQRPARPLAFANPPTLAGFRFERLSVRINDYRGRNPLPRDRVDPEDIVVSGRDHPSTARSWVTLAADRLSRCAEIRYVAEPRAIELTCAFDR